MNQVMHIFRMILGIGQSRASAYLAPDVFGLMWGSVVGDASYLSPTVKDQFALLGIQHMTAASGSNIQLVTELLAKALPRFSIYFWKLSLVSLVVLSYAGLCGFQPSIVRATGQWLISAWLKFLKRPISGYWALILSSILILALKPEFIGKIGFQLSVGASAGIVLVETQKAQTNQNLSIRSIQQKQRKTANKMDSYLSLDQRAITTISRYARKISRMSLAASIFTIPIIWYQFHQFSVFFLIGNLATQWILPIVTLTSVVYIGVSCLSRSLAFWIKPFIEIPTKVTLNIISFTAQSAESLSTAIGKSK